MVDRLKNWALLRQSWKAMKDWAFERFVDSGSYDDYCRFREVESSEREIIRDAQKEGVYLV